MNKICITEEQFMTRHQLASRWMLSVRTIDRLRQDGFLTWTDIAGGQRARPIVRFSIGDVEKYESTCGLPVVIADEREEVA